jgi:hypothetical protein
VTGQTVCGSRTDGPKKKVDPPVAHLKSRTIRALPSNGPRATDAARTVRDVQAGSPPNSSRPETAGQMDRNDDAQEHATNTKNPRPRSITKMHEETIHDPDQQIRTQIPQNQRNKLCTKSDENSLKKGTKIQRATKRESTHP